MSIGRREVLASGAVLLGVAGAFAPPWSVPPRASRKGIATPAPAHGDMLLLLAGGRADARSIRKFVAARPGRTSVRQVEPLTRDGAVQIAGLIAEARHAYLIVSADTAEALVMGIWLERAGRAPASVNVAGLGEVLLARLRVREDSHAQV